MRGKVAAQDPGRVSTLKFAKKQQIVNTSPVTDV